MKLSFIIPAYNEEKLISRCLESVCAASDSQKKEIEVIVVDNNSTDHTAEIAATFLNVKVIKEDKKGIVFARQAGFNVATGDLIANIDADTILPARWLETVFNEFGNNNELVALSGPFFYYDLSRIERMAVRVFYCFGYVIYFLNNFIFKKGAMLQGGNFIIKKTALIKIGGYDTSIEFHGEDTDIARRIRHVGKVLWTFKLPILASGRRLREEGIIRAGLTYALNFVWVSIFGIPASEHHIDIRQK